MSAQLVNTLSGTDVNNLTDTITWSSVDRYEQAFNISNSDGNQSIPISTINDVKLIMVRTTSASASFELNFSIVGDLVTFSGQNFTFTPDSTFMASVSSLSISTTSTTDILIDVRIYGEVSS